jgi:hypothetical protein
LLSVAVCCCSSLLLKARQALVKALGVALPLFWGRFTMMDPLPLPVNMVFGEPLDFAKLGLCKQKGQPTDEEVVRAHAAYKAALVGLFDANKAKYGAAGRELTLC